MAVEGKQRIEPKVLAALVNRFTVETGEYLDRFASKAQGKLLQLGQRLERLERLVALFEQKVRHLEPAAASTAPSPGPVREEATEEGEAAPVEAPAVVAPPAQDEKYALYRRMHRSGVPILAIRQKLLLDALQDPSLDVAVLDTFDGASGTGAGAPAPPMAKAIPKPEVKEVKQEAKEEGEAPEEAPEVEKSPEPPRVMNDPTNLAAAAALLAQKRMSRAAAKAQEAELNPEPKAEPKVEARAQAPKPKAKPKAEPRVEAEPKAEPEPRAEPRAEPSTPEPAAPVGLFAAEVTPKASRAPPPPKAKAKAMSPEAALKLRRSVVAQDDDMQSDVSDF